MIQARLLPSLLLAAATLVPGRAALAGDRVHDSDDLNYKLTMPDTWAWEDKAPFEKQGVKEVAARKLETLRNGKPATGHGGRLMLSVQDVPKELDPEYETWVMTWQLLQGQLDERRSAGTDPPDDLLKQIDESRQKIDKALLALAGLPQVQSLLLERFDKDKKKWPAPAVEAGFEVGRIPAASVTVNAKAKNAAEAPNLEGTPAPCDARMYIAVIRKRFYRFAMWAWPTKPRVDPERLLDDLDGFEVGGLEFLKTAAIPAKPAAAAAVAAAAASPQDKDTQEERTITELGFGFSILKPKKFKEVKFERKQGTPTEFLGFNFNASDSGGSSIQVDSLVYRRVGTVNFNVDTDFIFHQWSQWIQSHKEGPLGTLPFDPYVEPRKPFLSLPPDPTDKKDCTKEMRREPLRLKNSKDPSEGFDDGSKADQERWGVISESKNVKIKGASKPMQAAWRFCMYGNRERGGEETYIAYAFETTEKAYIIRVYVRKDGWQMAGAELKQMLDSFSMKEPPK